MSFRFRLALLFVTTLIVVQVATAALVYAVARRGVIAEGERELSAQAEAVARQLDDLSSRVADNVHLLSLDYALRAAIAQRDEGTVQSALRNHGRRIGAERMLLVDLEGRIRSDTSAPPSAGQPFPFPDLVDVAFAHPASAVVALGGKAYWMIVVPIYAPAPIALIAAGIPIDDALLRRVQQMSALQNTLELIVRNEDGGWTDIARAGDSAIVAAATADRRDPPLAPTLLRAGHGEYVALARRIKEAERTSPVAVLLAFSLDDALRPYRAVAYTWSALLLVSLVVGLGAAMAIARSMARPIEALADTARGIAEGDYATQPPARGGREIGALAGAFASMTRAIADREAHIHYQATHDAVTSLPNRQAAAALMDATQSDAPVQGALLMVGLTRLPEIIQTVGHAIGDRVMRDAGARLTDLVAGAPVARVTDTQFSIWLADASAQKASALAARVLEALSRAYRESDLCLDIAPAVGIAIAPDHGRSVDALLRRAEVALMACIGEEHAVRVYDPATDPHRPERLGLMGDLRNALERDELFLAYQPKLALATQAIDGVEALVRWQHPQRGLLFPDAFVELAERTGNVRALSRWVIDRSIAQVARWSRNGHALKVSINLSARDFDDPALPELVVDALRAHDVASHQIVVELTESAVMERPDVALQVFRRLADVGVELAIDDFGIGQSSFAYLRQLPVREIKIDRLFTRELAFNIKDQLLVQSIVEFGHRLSYRVTAEGVEDARALDFLRRVGCDHVQGFHIAEAIDAQAIERMCADRTPFVHRAGRRSL